MVWNYVMCLCGCKLTCWIDVNVCMCAMGFICEYGQVVYLNYVYEIMKLGWLNVFGIYWGMETLVWNENGTA